MPLPEDFSPWEHLHQMLRNAHNTNVEQTFLGVPSDDITTSFGGMKVATLLQDDDTVDMTLLRLFLFYFVFQANLPQPVYAYPPEDLFTAVRGHPQVILLFRESLTIEQRAEKQRAAQSQITFRLMNLTPQTITPAYANELALIIKERLATGAGFQWERGPIKVSYKDTVHGYDFYLLVPNEGEAVRVIETIVSLRGHPFDETKLIVHTAKQVFPQSQGYQEVYGKEIKKPRLRPTTTVRFLRAELHIQGIPQPILLVARPGNGKPLQRW
jgi:hypothetical protein